MLVSVLVQLPLQRVAQAWDAQAINLIGQGSGTIDSMVFGNSANIKVSGGPLGFFAKAHGWTHIGLTQAPE